MATREQDIRGMFEAMDRNEFSGPSVKPRPVDDFHSMFNQMDASHPDEMASMFDQMDKMPSASVKFNENADFSDETGPIKDYKPIDFTPSDTISDASMLQRAAEGFRQLGTNDRPVRQTSPNRIARSVELTLPDKGRKPSRDEVTEAYFNALGSQAAEANRRYRNETGRDIETPDVSDEDLTMGYDPQSKTYKVKVAPTQAAVKVINAYGQGGLKAAQDALRDMQRADDEAAAKEAQGRDAVRGVVRKLGYDPDELEGNPLARGLSRAGLGVTRLINNVSALGRNPADAASDAQFINDAARSIPRSKSAIGRVVEDVTQAGASLPLYMNPAAPVVAYSQNLDKGQESAIKGALPLVATGGVGQGVGGALEDAAPLVRQVGARGSAAATNVGLAYAGGERGAGNLISAGVVGAAMPIGKGQGESEGFASTRPLADAPATPSMARELSVGVIGPHEGMDEWQMVKDGDKPAAVTSSLNSDEIQRRAGDAQNEGFKTRVYSTKYPDGRDVYHLAVAKDEARIAPVVTAHQKGDEAALGRALGYSDADIATYMKNRPNAPRVNLTPHYSNFQPRDESGQFVEGKPAETIRHPLFGDLTVADNQSGLERGMVKVRDADGYEFPLSKGVLYGDARNVDSGNVVPSPAVGRTPTATEQISGVLNVARAAQTSFDTHSLLRQGAISFGSNPVRTMKAYFQSLPSLWSEHYAGKMLNEVQSSTYAPLAKESGLYLADYASKSQPLSAREEAFMSNIVGRIPVIRGTQRQFHVFLDKVRMDAFSAYAKTNPDATPETLNGVAKFINYSTGRGNLGRWGERHALGLSNVFYSPRFAVSRVQTATAPFRPDFTPQARLYAAKQLARYVTTNIGIMGLAKAAGLDIGVNPLSSDFGTMKVGNTRISLWGGMNTTAKYVAQLALGESASDSGNMREKSRLKTALTFVRTKLAPQSSVLVDVATGEDFKGQPVTVGSTLKHSFVPISWNDIYDAMKDDQANGGSGVKGALVGAAGLFGAQVQTITPKSQDERLNDYVERMKADPQNQGLSDAALRHNAKVNLEEKRLLDAVPDEKKEAARQTLNTLFYYSRVRGSNDRRALPSIERAFQGRLQSAETLLKRRGLLK